MTNRIRTVTVILDDDYSDDDVDVILSAIRMVRGVSHVEPNIVEGGEIIARAVATMEIRRRVFELLDVALPIFPKKM